MSENKGLTIWLTGLSGSGKTTIALALAERLREEGRAVILLDGDVLRSGLCEDLGFSPEDRRENLRRAAHVARLANTSGVTAVVAMISPYASHRDLARRIHEGLEFLEVFVKAPLEVCEARDPKGLYARARRGEIEGFTGIASPYEEPENPELVCETDKMEVEECVARIVGAMT
ncbi:MAG: adenylyl-sulfate kinase [Bradymonadaceae bacterium]